jgi:DNA-binding response OmpR family regulator
MLATRDTSGSKRTKTILIVDDDERLANFTKVALERAGYDHVTVESSCRRGLSAAYEQVPDVLVLDVVLPDGTGGDIAAEVRRRSMFANTRIVFLTGIVSKREVHHFGGAIGEERVLAKPASLEQLISAIEEEEESPFDPGPPAEKSFGGRFRIPSPFPLKSRRFEPT